MKQMTFCMQKDESLHMKQRHYVYELDETLHVKQMTVYIYNRLHFIYETINDNLHVE